MPHVGPKVAATLPAYVVLPSRLLVLTMPKPTNDRAATSTTIQRSCTLLLIVLSACRTVAVGDDMHLCDLMLCTTRYGALLVPQQEGDSGDDYDSSKR